MWNVSSVGSKVAIGHLIAQQPRCTSLGPVYSLDTDCQFRREPEQCYNSEDHLYYSTSALKLH